MSDPAESWKSNEPQRVGAADTAAQAAAFCMAGLGCRWGSETREGFCPRITHFCSWLLVMGSGSRTSHSWGYPSGLREELSKWPETPPHANVASPSAYATLVKASATWAALHHPRSLLWRLHPPSPCSPPAYKGPRLRARDERDQTDPSGTDHPPCITAGCFTQQEKLIAVLQDGGRAVRACKSRML